MLQGGAGLAKARKVKRGEAFRCTMAPGSSVLHPLDRDKELSRYSIISRLSLRGAQLPYFGSVVMVYEFLGCQGRVYC